jgi:class 3 adenylate cyclase
MAFEMLDIVKTVEDPRTPGKPIEMRIGIHTGSIVAGERWWERSWGGLRA